MRLAVLPACEQVTALPEGASAQHKCACVSPPVHPPYHNQPMRVHPSYLRRACVRCRIMIYCWTSFAMVLLPLHLCAKACVHRWVDWEDAGLACPVSWLGLNYALLAMMQACKTCMGLAGPG